MKTFMQWSLGLVLALPLAAAAAYRPATPFTDAELDQLLAPIALYPDTVLSHVLIAATVPEEVEEAADWSNRHPDLRGQAAVDAVARMDWDPSVKALVAFPEILEQMQEDPEWTENLGEAFMEQEAVVMDRVQYLRDRADAAGNLESTEHVRVVHEREYIYIEPAVSHFVYVPYYDPWYVYGSWWWPTYPPHRWAYWGGYPSRYYYGSTFFWGVGFHLGPSYYYGRFNWPARHVVVTRPHRHFSPDRRYSPTPGYSGRSDMRRERQRPDHDRDHDRRDRRDHDRRGHERHRDAPTRIDRADHRSPQVRESRPRHHTHWSDVRRELAARRDQPGSAPRASPDTRERTGGEARSPSPQRPRHEASRRAPERSNERIETRDSSGTNRSYERPAPPAERPQERAQDRDTGRSDRGASVGRHESQRAPEARGGGRERGGQHRQHGNGRSRAER